VNLGRLDDPYAMPSRRAVLRTLALGAGAATVLVAGCGQRAPAASPPLASNGSAPTATPVSGLGPPRAYNWKASNTARLRASLANGAIGRSNHVFIGDSITAGYLGGAENPQYDALKAWPRVYRSAIQTGGVAVAGTGLVPCIAGDAPYDPRWTRSSGWDASLAYTLFVRAAGETATFVSDTPGTEVSVYYFGNSAGMTVNIDDGPDIELPMDGAAHPLVHNETGLSDTTHTVVVSTTSASYNQLVGASTQGGSGLVCHNIAVGGATASGPNLAAWATTTPGYINATLVGALTAASVTPDVVYVALGGNDIQNGYSTAQIIAALASLRAQFPSSDYVLIGENQFDGYQSVWGSWSRALHGLADGLDCPLVDLYQRYGEYSQAVASQLMGDGAHLNAKAQNDIGNLIAALARTPQ
jgi:lysophospholipase L1-like esterase